MKRNCYCDTSKANIIISCEHLRTVKKSNYYRMKYTKLVFNIFTVGILLAVIGLSSCEDFLEQPTDSITTIDSVFANPDNTMLALFNAYDASLTWNRGLKPYPTSSDAVFGFPQGGSGGVRFGNAGNAQSMFFTDEASQELLPNTTAIYFIFGNWGPSGLHQREFPTNGVADAIRTCNIFIENAHRVPMITTPNWNWDEAYRDQVIAEAKILRAFLHFEFFRRYGGIPIMDKVATFALQPGGLEVSPNSGRRSMKSTIDFITSECDKALPFLRQPEEFSNAEIGRIHKGVALALKAKALLYAASPLYNAPGSSLPVSYGDDRDSLLCYGSFDANRWKMAADTYHEAIIWAESRGKVLLDDPILGKRDSYVIGSESPRTRNPMNDEWIYYISYGGNNLDARQRRTGGPLVNSGNWGTIAGAGYKFIVDNYRDVNGQPINIPMNEGSFTDLKANLRQAEPRFHASIWVPGFQYSYLDQTQWMTKFGTNDTAMFVYRDVNNSLSFASSSAVRIATEQPGFFYPKKWRQLGQNSTYHVTWTEFRLSELYLSYAEAMNEYNPNETQILTYLNKVRVRGGIPEILTSDPRFGDKAAMRAEIRKERAVELYGDEHRLFDVRRWKIAQETMGQDWYKIILFENGTGTYETPNASMTPEERLANDAKLSYKFEKLSTHVWRPEMYFYPFYQPEVNKGVLVQNPGW
jgi:hypothetical protein